MRVIDWVCVAPYLLAVLAACAFVVYSVMRGDAEVTTAQTMTPVSAPAPTPIGVGALSENMNPRG
jgi:hypothetical protein